MEMFVATDEDQWDLIREVIDLSDYYLVVVGARYGHVTDEEISYTEKEYNYAVESGKPIIAFVHGNPGNIAHDKHDKSPEKEEKLEAFRKRIRDGFDGKRRNVGEFLTADELAAKVSRAMSRAIKTYPGVGWVRGDQAMTVETQQEIIDLQQQVAALESEKRAAESALIEDTEILASGTEKVGLPITFTDLSTPTQDRLAPFEVVAESGWDDIFNALALGMMADEASEDDLKQRLSVHLAVSGEIADQQEREKFCKLTRYDYAVSQNGWDLAALQLHTLGLIEPGKKKRPVNKAETYLTLTDKGRRHLMKLRAVKKGAPPKWIGAGDGEDKEAESS